MELKRRKLEKPDDDEKWSKKPIKLDASKLITGIFVGHNYDDHPIYGNMLYDVKSVG